MEERILNYKIFGEGAPVIILHGLFGMLDNWQTIAKQLSENYQVITVDLRNHGRSFHDNDASYESMAFDLINLMDHLDIDKAHFIGHSMGGKVASQLAILRPNRVHQLIAVDILPIDYQRGHDQVLEALEKLDLSQIMTRKEAETQLTALLKGDESTAFFLLKSLKRRDGGGFEWRFNRSALTEQYDSIRGEIDGGIYDQPVLFIKGGESNYITVDRWMDATELFPNAELEEIGDSGHWVHVDQPDELLKAVKRYLQ